MYVLRDADAIRDFKYKGIVPESVSLVHCEGVLVRLFAQKSDGWFSGLVQTLNQGVIPVMGICAATLVADDHTVITLDGLYVQNDRRYKPSLTSKNIFACRWEKEDVCELFESVCDTATASKIWNKYQSLSVPVLNQDPELLSRQFSIPLDGLQKVSQKLKANTPENVRKRYYPHMTNKLFRVAVKFIQHKLFAEGLDAHMSYKKYKLKDDKRFTGEMFKLYIDEHLYTIPDVPFRDLDDVAFYDLSIDANDSVRVEALLQRAMKRVMYQKSCVMFCLNRPFEGEKFHGLRLLWDAVCEDTDVLPDVMKDLSQFFGYIQSRVDLYPIQTRTDIYGQPLYYVTTTENYEDMFSVTQNMMIRQVTNITPFSKEEIDVCFAKHRKSLQARGLQLTDEQLTALRHVMHYRLSFLCGGPGCGKTFILHEIVEMWKMLGGDVVLLAPTGKAVNVLKNRVDSSAFTFAKFTYQFLYSKDFSDSLRSNKLDNNKMLYIIDETSMLSTHDIATFLKNVTLSSILFVGDKDQLPSINPGAFLMEVVTSDVIPVLYLTENMRAEHPELVDNAMKIRDGVHLTWKDCTDAFMFDWLPDASDDAVISRSIDWYVDALQNSAGCFEDIMLLSPFRSVVDNVNAQLQNQLNPLDAVGNWIPFVRGEYNQTKGFTLDVFRLYGDAERHTGSFETVRVGDRVMNCVNNLDLEWGLYNSLLDEEPVSKGFGAWNGDLGSVMMFSREKGNVYMTVKMDDGRVFRLDSLQARTFRLAYAMTIHKSQGSEASHVLLALPERLHCPAGFLTRNLVYTGVTRARQSITVIGSNKVFDRCIDTELKPLYDLSYELIKGCERWGLFDDVQRKVALINMGFRG